MAKKATPKKKKSNGAYTLYLHVNGEDYTSTADTFEDAILNFPSIQAKTLATLVVSTEGKQSKPIPLKITMFNRLFYPGMSGAVQRIAFIKRAAFYV